jgi:hypothetical protein
MNPLRLAGRFDHFPCLLRKRFAKRACGGRFKQRIVRNLIRRAACLGDEFDKDGKLIKEGMGDLQAILAIIERLEGKPKQQITGLDNGPVRAAFMMLLKSAQSSA